MSPSRASRAARSAAAAKAPASGIRWSEGSTSTVAVGSRRAATQAATATAASVSRAAGSSTISARAPASRACSATRKREAAAVTTIGSAKTPAASRATVRWNGETPPMIAACCLAKSRRDTGQSREPEPPQRMTGTIDPARGSAPGVRIGERSVMVGAPSSAYRPVRRATASGVRQSSAKSRRRLGLIT